MDLREHQKSIRTERHPWESSRVKALKTMLTVFGRLPSPLYILDIGCGDGYLIKELSKYFGQAKIDAIDLNLSEEQIKHFSKNISKINFHNSYNALTKYGYHLILMNDVIEHVKNDKEFIENIISKYAASEALVCITAPAFNWLFGSYDEFLGHYRRYNLKEIDQLVVEASLKQISSGYLFASLLPLRILEKCYELFFVKKKILNGRLGRWSHGRIFTKFIDCILWLDNWFLIRLSTIGLKLPGLSIWSLCKKIQ